MPEILVLSQKIQDPLLPLHLGRFFISVLLKIRGLGGAVSYYAFRLVGTIRKSS